MNYTHLGRTGLEVSRIALGNLKRLKTDHIDLYQMHHIDRATPWEGSGTPSSNSSAKVRSPMSALGANAFWSRWRRVVSWQRLLSANQATPSEATRGPSAHWPGRMLRIDFLHPKYTQKCIAAVRSNSSPVRCPAKVTRKAPN
ncbi:aldo/keto reductase [Caballeronia calidae]|uniref:Aldo/keto reductase n=1 Tax=Caballeronia calidae TaxID=1777139 RepID=A0A158EFU9_9BURK|nr:hypothetical protein [Caballeronia calidae]SAL04777.1 aldo/keto reductase [Caballeronia calidae]